MSIRIFGPQFDFEPRAMQVRDCTFFQGIWSHAAHLSGLRVKKPSRKSRNSVVTYNLYILNR